MDNYITSSAKDDWGTPQWLFDALNEEFHFDLDACANDENHKCEMYYTKEQDGLKQDWKGHTVFCNPPYGRKKTADWIKKCADESKKPGTKVVMLIPARTDTKAFHDYVYGKEEIRFIKGRLRFEVKGEEHTDNAPFPSMVVVFSGVMP